MSLRLKLPNSTSRGHRANDMVPSCLRWKIAAKKSRDPLSQNISVSLFMISCWYLCIIHCQLFNNNNIWQIKTANREEIETSLPRFSCRMHVNITTRTDLNTYLKCGISQKKRSCVATSSGFFTFHFSRANHMETLGLSNNSSMFLLIMLMLLKFPSLYGNNLPVGFIQILCDK